GRADHDPIRAWAGQVGNEHARARGMIVAVDDHAGDWEPAVRQTAERLRRFDADAERRDAGAAVPSTRDTAPTPPSGCAIRNPTAPICCANESLMRRCRCPPADGYSWRTMTMRSRAP